MLSLSFSFLNVLQYSISIITKHFEDSKELITLPYVRGGVTLLSLFLTTFYLNLRLETVQEFFYSESKFCFLLNLYFLLIFLYVLHVNFMLILLVLVLSSIFKIEFCYVLGAYLF